MDGLGVENGNFGVVERSTEMDSDEFVEKIHVKEEQYVKDEAVKVVSLDCFKLEKSIVGVVHEDIKMGGDQFHEKVNVKEECSTGHETVKVESLDGSREENSGFGVVAKGIQLYSDDFVEKTEAEKGRCGGVCGKVSLNGVLNCSDSLGAGPSRIMNVGSVGHEANGMKGGEIETGDCEVANGDQLVNVVLGLPENVEKTSDILNVNGDGARKKVASDKDESETDSESESESDSDSESESSSSSLSSSDSSSEDEDEGEDEDQVDEEDEEEKRGVRERKNGKDGKKGEVEGEIDMKEGQIMVSEADEMTAWSDDEDDEDDAGGKSMKGPIRSKNELMVLPPVPPVNVTLLPHQKTLPVGVISVILGAQVIVEGVEKHDPLSEGSILWITESRSPLGLVDDIFGPVKNPYYIVRYNSEIEVPTTIKQGTLISFVPEFACHVLNSESLYKKGYDASGENDEELFEEVEFSDDEKEAEYRRMQRMKKRETNDEKIESKKTDKKKIKKRFAPGKHKKAARTQEQAFADKPPVDRSQRFVQPAAASSGFDMRDLFAGGPALRHSYLQPGQVPAPSTSAWLNGVPFQPTSGVGFPSGIEMQGLPWPQQNHPQQVFQSPFPNAVPFPQQINISPMLPSNLTISSGQPNFGAGPAFAPWHAGQAQNVLNQPPAGIGIQGQPAPTFTKVGENAVPGNGSQALWPPTDNSGKNDALRYFNPSRGFGGGRKSQCRGGGRFGGKMDQHQPT